MSENASGIAPENLFVLALKLCNSVKFEGSNSDPDILFIDKLMNWSVFIRAKISIGPMKSFPFILQQITNLV